MKIINKTNNVILAEDVIVAGTVLKRLKGLLGRRELNIGKALILKPCNSVHTFFMHFPIDILFVDKDNKVIEVILSLAPFRVTRIYFKAASVIELPAGTIQPDLLKIGDQLIIE